MTTYHTNDGHQILADSPRALIKKLRTETWSGPTASRREWMRDVAERAEQSTGKPVRVDTDKHFINDLISTGLITKKEEK